MGTPAIDVNTDKSTVRGSNQSTASSGTTGQTTDATASGVTVSPPSSRTQSLQQLSARSLAEESLYASSLPSYLLDESSRSSDPSAASEPAGSKTESSRQQPGQSSFQAHSFASQVRGAPTSRSAASGRHGNRGPVITSSSSVDRRLVERYERVNSEIERVVRETQAGDNDNCELLKQVRNELRKAKRSSSQMIQSQKELLEKIEKHEQGGLRRIFTINREQRMEKLRHKLSEKLSQSVAADEELQRLERQSVSLTSISLGPTYRPLESEELTQLEREREDIMANMITAAGLTDAQELNSRLAVFSSEKKACDCTLKQVEQCETLFRKALYLLRVALSTIVGPGYTGSLKDFVLGPYPLAVEASQLVEQASRGIQPESQRRYSEYTPELVNVRPPKFPQQMAEFAKRGARSNFEMSNTAAIEAIRKLRTSENIVILLQRIVIQKLETLEKWREHVERDLERAELGYRKVDARLQECVTALARKATV
ncbi:hypothetical protein Poli38472_003948 [Pythium oligandrum]|uniref:Uncharacterized protein n=1 Tax=Pythium oligandrum TaxID=41045 RepID=A0A8K1CNK5_PYTOL|nr:hypothetical protein Poli38472_003948 [Pythium oligandrum]|eukprot:TMW66183.1 hypothetical protein Poli38472_003948 [Pythium oligandrum]